MHDPLRENLGIHDPSIKAVNHSQKSSDHNSRTTYLGKEVNFSQNPASHTSRTTSTLQVLYIGTNTASEQELVEREMKRIAHAVPGHKSASFSWRYKAISSGKLRRYWAWKNFTDMGRIAFGFLQSLKILRRFKPDLVFCKGGYVTVPVAAAARILGIQIWIHESDVSPGLATKINSRFADKIFVSFEETKKYFKPSLRVKVEVVGNPIRAAITQGNADRAKKFTGLSGEQPVILFMGGSLGSQFINNALHASLDVLLKEYAVVHITGANNGPLTDHKNYRAYQFLHEDLADCYALASVIVTRSGAGSVFECAAVNKPTLFIPLSRAASRGDQIENAQAAAQYMHATILEEEALKKDSTLLLDSIESLLSSAHTKQQARLCINAAQTVAQRLASAEYAKP